MSLITCLARKEYEAAKVLLQETIEQAPNALAPRVVLSYALLQEGRDLVAAERALRNVLTLDSEHPEARRNLSILLRELGRAS